MSAERNRHSFLFCCLLRRVADLQTADLTPARSGFVTFNTVGSAAVAPQIMYDNNTFDYQIKAAPAPDDVYWPNMNVYGYEVCFSSLPIHTFPYCRACTPWNVCIFRV